MFILKYADNEEREPRHQSQAQKQQSIIDNDLTDTKRDRIITNDVHEDAKMHAEDSTREKDTVFEAQPDRSIDKLAVNDSQPLKKQEANEKDNLEHSNVSNSSNKPIDHYIETIMHDKTILANGNVRELTSAVVASMLNLVTGADARASVNVFF